MRKVYQINVFAGVNPFSDKLYFIVEFNFNGPLSNVYRHVTPASKKRLETLIWSWDKRVYFGADSISICTFNPNA